MSDSLQRHGLSGSSVHGDSPGKNTGVGCHFLLQGIFPTQRSNPCLRHCRQTLCRLTTRKAIFQYTFSQRTLCFSFKFATSSLVVHPLGHLWMSQLVPNSQFSHLSHKGPCQDMLAGSLPSYQLTMLLCRPGLLWLRFLQH